MTTRLASRLLTSAAMLCISIACTIPAFAQTNGNTAVFGPRYFSTYPPPYALNIPAVRVGNRFYAVMLDYRPPSWILTSAVEIVIDGNYASGDYSDNLLDLQCVQHLGNGNYYSARLVSATPDNYSFTLESSTKLAACPPPVGVKPARGQWVQTADSPLSPRGGSQFAWVNGEILVLGGSSFVCSPYGNVDCALPSGNPLLNDGAAYNPLTDTWRKIADAPASPGYGTVTAGNDVFVFAHTDPRSPRHLLRYRPAQDRWDEFELPQNSGTLLAAFGNKLVLYSQEDQSGATADWLLDPVTGQWTQIADDPLGPGGSRRYLAFGNDLYLFDQAPPLPPGSVKSPRYARAARLREQQWTLLPTANSVASTPSLISGQRLIAPALGCSDDGAPAGRCVPYGAVFDTVTDTWQELPNAPGRGLKFFNGSGGLSENGLALITPGYPALDTTTNEWFIFPELDTSPDTAHTVGAAGPYGFAFGGVTAPRVILKDSWIWKP